ncbi:MAG: class I SAM-dependent methyltransferase [Methylophilaceae bacterium]
MDANFTPEQLGHLYSSYYPRSSFNVEQYQPHTEVEGFRAWLNGYKSSTFRWVPRSVRVLDIGCGFGQSLGYHQARGCEVYGVEADENIRRVAEKFDYKVHVGLFDPAQYPDGFFDYVTMDQVIEHVTDPLSTFSGVAKILKSGGRLVLSTPNANGWGAKTFGRRWINWHTPYHLQFFSKRSIKLAAEQAGLSLLEVKTITNSEWIFYQWIHAGMFPAQGERSVFWAPNIKKTRLQSLMLRVLLIMHKTKINHLLTRVFDAIGLGDNYLMIFKKP